MKCRVKIKDDFNEKQKTKKFSAQDGALANLSDFYKLSVRHRCKPLIDVIFEAIEVIPKLAGPFRQRAIRRVSTLNVPIS